MLTMHEMVGSQKVRELMGIFVQIINKEDRNVRFVGYLRLKTCMVSHITPEMPGPQKV